MSSPKILITWEHNVMPDIEGDSITLPITELEKWFLSGDFLKHLFKYRQSIFYTYRYELINRPFVKSLAIWALSRGPSFIKDHFQYTRRITILLLLKFFVQHVRDVCIKPFIHWRTRREVRSLMREKGSYASGAALDLSASPVYLRTDNCIGLNAGGSVTHTSGVLNNLAHFTGNPIFLTPYLLPSIDDAVEKHEVIPESSYKALNELRFLNYNKVLFEKTIAILADRKPSFIYQRYSLHNYSGALLSRHYKVPFVLEYNGSEIWMSAHYGSPIKNLDLWESIESLNLNKADLIVVVSKPIKDQLIKRGVEENSIFVNPNGVDTETYSPSIDGIDVRRKYGIESKTVFGFIGTFGRWHGAEILAEGFARFLQENPGMKSSVRLMMIGDGLTMPEVEKIIKKYNIEGQCILTGIVPQKDGPKYLAACDFMVSPHVPNPDGTPFFGSPTKLFEYMAMGKGIIASDLDQIGEILSHNNTALMVKPGDPDSLKQGLNKFIQNRDLAGNLGRAAREEAIAKHTWKEHTRKIIRKLEERCPRP